MGYQCPKKRSLHIGVEDEDERIQQDEDHKEDAFDYGAFTVDDLEEDEVDTSLLFVVRFTHILLGRSWLFDQNVKYYRRENTYALMVGKKEVVLKPMTLAEMNKFKESKPTIVEGNKKRDLENNIKLLHVLTKKNFQVASHKAGVVFAIIAQEVREPSVGCDVGIPLEVSTLLSEFSDVAPGDFSNELPPLHSIQHAIDLVPGSLLPNIPTYRMNPSEHAEL
ncbi:uncharacterized protein LOC136069134 [Quercus suber]|uniref:uncharacterized protein LOC136069134 n=1 Tax=Quercus suber TaxID=58331 RepID=UPI0032DEFA39